MTHQKSQTPSPEVLCIIDMSILPNLPTRPYQPTLTHAYPHPYPHPPIPHPPGGVLIGQRKQKTKQKNNNNKTR